MTRFVFKSWYHFIHTELRRGVLTRILQRYPSVLMYVERVGSITLLKRCDKYAHHEWALLFTP